MSITQRPVNIMRGLLKRYGPTKIKMILWDQEFSGTHWDIIDDTTGDVVYPHLEKHLRGGNMLDLGCGPGNTANELPANSYTTYVGVDVSEAALVKARKRTEANGRTAKNSFACSDFFGYQPSGQFDVILFRESMYHVPLAKVKAILDKFTPHLKKDGRFVVRINITDGKGGYKPRMAAIITAIEESFRVIEKQQYGENGPTVIVFQPN